MTDTEDVLAGTLDQLGPGESLVVPKGTTGFDVDVAIFCDDDGTHYALADRCSHQEASLAEGWVENGSVECPLHAGSFCLRTGQVLTPPATEPVRTFSVEVRDQQLWLSSKAAT